MKILIINAHWDNRGDEAAIRSMIMELLALPNVEHITIQRAIGEFGWFPEINHVSVIGEFPKTGKAGKTEYYLARKTKGKLVFSQEAKEFYRALNECDVVLHAPGGPSIGDIYYNQEVIKLRRLQLIIDSGKKLMFYAPSMGPFERQERNPERINILKNADRIVLRENMSREFLRTIGLADKAIVTMDSAFQYDFPEKEYEEQYRNYTELCNFVSNSQGKVIGMTVTDLLWNSKYTDTGIDKVIRQAFEELILDLTNEGWSIVFIPQLFGKSNDHIYMQSFANEKCFVMDDEHDCFFQQYVIKKMYAVIGMRYHSNIFSAKMGTPFLSVTYEQKMKGFMKKADLLDYCIDINDLSGNLLKEKFNFLIENYDSYSQYLAEKKSEFKAEAHRTTEIVEKLLSEVK